MEIVYLYIHDYRRFKKQNINFGSEYIFHYDDKTNELNIEKNHIYIHEFYNQKGHNNILNISAIIGENGTGKTGLIDYLIKIYADGSLFSSDEPFMFVLKNKDTYTLHYSSDFFSIINLKEISKFINIKEYKCKINDLGGNSISINHGYSHLNLTNSEFRTSILKVSNILFGKSVNGFLNIFDFSNDGMISSYQEGTYFKEKNITNFYNSLKTENNENYIQLFKYLSVTKSESLIPFKIPHLVKIKSIDEHLYINKSKIDEIYKKCKSINDKFLSDLENEKIIITDSLVKYNFVFNIILNVPIDLFNGIIDNLESKDLKKYDALLVLIEKYLNTIEDFLKSILRVNFLNKIESQEAIINEWTLNLVFIYNEFINNFVKIFGSREDQLGFTQINTLKFIKKLLEVKNIHPLHSLENKSNSSELYFEFDEFIKSDLLSLYNLSSSFRPFVIFEFDVPLSSGQYAFLNIFSRINSLFKNYGVGTNSNRKVEDHILLVIDEIELYLHPNWQKNIVSTLSSFLNYIHPDYKFQIIFTSNNPLPISDLLSYNTIFLSNEECGINTIVKDSLEDQKNTFAANIHTLLADSFFVKGGLIGDFSKDKINEVIQLLSKGKELSREEHTYIKKFIKQIGEPLIKNKLLQMYGQNNELDYLERLERVERKLGLDD